MSAIMPTGINKRKEIRKWGQGDSSRRLYEGQDIWAQFLFLQQGNICWVPFVFHALFFRKTKTDVGKETTEVEAESERKEHLQENRSNISQESKKESWTINLKVHLEQIAGDRESLN